jgi:hypothetical protein
VLLLERSKLVVEGAGAAPVAAILAGRAGGAGPVCALLAGGNIDATTMSSVIRYGMTASGRYLVVALLIPDRPGRARAHRRADRRASRERPLDPAPPGGPQHRVPRDGGELTLETRGRRARAAR